MWWPNMGWQRTTRQIGFRPSTTVNHMIDTNRRTDRRTHRINITAYIDKWTALSPPELNAETTTTSRCRLCCLQLRKVSHQLELGSCRGFFMLWVNLCDDPICAGKGPICLRPSPTINPMIYRHRQTDNVNSYHCLLLHIVLLSDNISRVNQCFI